MIEKTDDGWEAATYVWNRRGTDAELKPAGQQFEQWGENGVTTWHAPSSSECASCHVAEAGFVLGLSTAQLSGGEAREGGHTIARWLAAGVLAAPDGLDVASLAHFKDPMGTQGTLEERARTYLDVNCAMCHRPEGPGNALIDLRFSTALAATGLIGELPTQGDLDIEGARLVAPSRPEKSLLIHRVKTLGSGRMPNIGTHVVDEGAVELLTQWVLSMDSQADDR